MILDLVEHVVGPCRLISPYNKIQYIDIRNIDARKIDSGGTFSSAASLSVGFTATAELRSSDELEY